MNSSRAGDPCSAEPSLAGPNTIQIWNLSLIPIENIFPNSIPLYSMLNEKTMTGVNLNLDKSILSLPISYFYFALFDTATSLCTLGPTSIAGSLHTNLNSNQVIYLSKSMISLSTDDTIVPDANSSGSSSTLDSAWITIIILSVILVLMIFIIAYLQLKKKSRFRRRRIAQTNSLLPLSTVIDDNQHVGGTIQNHVQEEIELSATPIDSPSSTANSAYTLEDEFQTVDQAKLFFESRKSDFKSYSETQVDLVNRKDTLSVDGIGLGLTETGVSVANTNSGFLSSSGPNLDLDDVFMNEQSHNELVLNGEPNVELNDMCTPIPYSTTDDVETSSIPDSEYYDAQSFSSHVPSEQVDTTQVEGGASDELSFQSALSQTESSTSFYYSANDACASRFSDSFNQQAHSSSIRPSQSNYGLYSSNSVSDSEVDVDAMSIASNVVLADRLYFPSNQLDGFRRERRESCVSESTINQGID